MDPIHAQVRRARRRLVVQRYLDVLAWCWLATLGVALVGIVVDRFWPLGIESWVWAAGALVIGLIAAIVCTGFGRVTPLEAAIELDRRFALKERVSSALALTPADRETEAGEALVADAVRRVDRLDIGGRFAVKPSRRLLLPLAPGILAALVVLLIAPAVVEDPAVAKADEAAVAEQVKMSTETVRRQLAERRDEAKKKGLKEAERLLLKLEEGAREMKKEPTKEKAMAKLNDLSRALAERRQQLGGSQTVKDQLDQLKTVDRARAEKCANALNRGDLKKAADELDKLKDELSDGKLDEKQKEELGKQIAALQLGLQLPLDEMEMLDKAADQLAQAKDQMNCPKCGGTGCEECQGGAGDGGEGDDEYGGGSGEGDRDGKGKGKHPGRGGLHAGTAVVRGLKTDVEKKLDAKLYDSKVKQKVGRGSARVVGLVDGPNVKGDYRQEIQQQVESARQAATDPLTGHHMPRKHGEHAKEYFDGLREGKTK